MHVVLTIVAVLTGAFILAALLYLTVLIRPKTKFAADSALLCDYAHRGLHDDAIPENSLAAFECACKAGVGIELDVQFSRDGEVMVFHDFDLRRMTGEEGKLRHRDCADLQTLKLQESDQTIPTLAEVLRLVDGRVPLLVELKGEELNTSLCDAVGALMEAYDGPYCLESFNPLLVRRIRKRLPTAFCGLLYTNLCRDKDSHSLLHLLGTSMALCGLARPHFIAYNQRDRNALPVRVATGLYKAPRFVWTIRSEEELSEARRRGEYPIFEDLPLS